jgi:two-component system cell cycle sensor histidine kinase PleC
LKLINEILDLSRIEAGKYELDEKPVDFSAVALESLHLLRLDAQAKNLRLVTTFLPNMPQILADERALRQICLNLLANAIKFTPENGTVVLRTGLLASGEPFLAVRDNGPGIPEDEIPAVLTAFGQGSEASKLPSSGGTGLGLPIVMGLAELHGGRFDLRSKPGAGTEASLIMPTVRVISSSSQGGGRQAGNVMPFPTRGAA